MVDGFGSTMDEIEALNVEKLNKRYKAGYTNTEAQVRADMDPESYAGQ